MSAELPPLRREVERPTTVLGPLVPLTLLGLAAMTTLAAAVAVATQDAPRRLEPEVTRCFGASDPAGGDGAALALVKPAVDAQGERIAGCMRDPIVPACLEAALRAASFAPGDVELAAEIDVTYYQGQTRVATRPLLATPARRR